MLPETRLLFLAVAAVLLIGCADDDQVAAPVPTAQTPDPTAEAPPTSPDPRIRFKGPKRLRLELARILALDEAEVCRELGAFDCFDVHNVALGGADPFGVALYRPMETSTATTPLAVERVVLAGCIERAVRDLDNPNSAVLFADLQVAAGKIDPSSAPVAKAIDTLYTRALQRHASDAEVAHLRTLYVDIEASGASESPAKDWASLSCFSVLTSLETLFY